MKTAIIGTGKFGEAIAKKLVKAGYPVLLTNSRIAASLDEKAQQLGQLASSAELDEVRKAPLTQFAAYSPDADMFIKAGKKLDR